MINRVRKSLVKILWSCWPQNIYMCTQCTVNKVHCGDMKMAAGIVLSGNNYSKVHLLAKQAGMEMVNNNNNVNL